MRNLLATFFTPDILSKSSALGKGKHPALDPDILGACISKFTIVIPYHIFILCGSLSTEYVQSKCKVSRSILIHCANDKCTNFRRKLTCYNVQEPPVSYVYSWWTNTCVIVCSWPCRPEGKRILSNVVWLRMVISIWIEWLYAVFTTHTYRTCGYHDSLILFQLYCLDNLVIGLCQSWSPPCYKLVARVPQCVIPPRYKLVTTLLQACCKGLTMYYTTLLQACHMVVTNLVLQAAPAEIPPCCKVVTRWFLPCYSFNSMVDTTLLQPIN